MNRIARSYTPKHKIDEVVNILDKLVQQMTPKQNVQQTIQIEQNVSPIRQNQVHLKQIELQRQSIDILQQQIRDKSLENEQLKQQKQIIRQLSATGNKFSQNFRLDQSNVQDSPISGHSHQNSQMLPNFANKEQDLSLGNFPCQLDLSVEQKNIQNLIMQNKILEEKNAKFKQLIEMMEHKFNSKLSLYQQKEQKLENKCKFLYQTLEGKDKEIKEIIQIQQAMLQKTIKEIEDKYRQDMLQLKQEIIQLREELQQKDLAIQEKCYEILAKEETITQLKVKYLENVKQSLAKSKINCLNMVVQQNAEDNFQNDDQEGLQQSQQAQFNKTNQEFSQNVLNYNQIEQGQSEYQLQTQENLDNKQVFIEQNTEQNDQGNQEFSSDLTFKQNQASQGYHQNYFNTQESQDILLKENNTFQPQQNKENSEVADNQQQINTYQNNQSQQMNSLSQLDQGCNYQEGHTNTWNQHRHLFDKAQKSKSQLQNIQNFLQLSKPDKQVENQFKISIDLKKSVSQEKLHFVQNFSYSNGPLSNKSHIQNQSYQKENEFQAKFQKNTSFSNKMNKSMTFQNNESLGQDSFYFKQTNNFSGENKLQQRNHIQNKYQNVQNLKHSNSCFVEQINQSRFDQNSLSEIISFQNLQQQQQQSNQNQSQQMSQTNLNNFTEYPPNNQYEEINQSTQNQGQNKVKSKLYSLKLEQAEAWRNTYSNMYGKSPIYNNNNNKNNKQNKFENIN